jgi:hypothetical protein
VTLVVGGSVTLVLGDPVTWESGYWVWVAGGSGCLGDPGALVTLEPGCWV